jgi:hypothetical protein
MLVSRQFIQDVKDEASRVGYARALERSLYNTAKQYVSLRRFEVIRLTRDRLAPLEPDNPASITARLATEDDLLGMQAEGTWRIDEELLEGFRAGDRCLLSFVDGQRAGYTWVHTGGRPRLIPGLRLSIPDDYLYNFAGFTLPAFRGYGLQPYRHHEVLARPEWRDRKGMLGFVECINWGSRRGQSKSGYEPVGTISLVGTRNRFTALLSSELKELGIRRIDD